MTLFTEVHFVLAAAIALLFLAIGYKWGRANGVEAEKSRRRRPRTTSAAKSSAVREAAAQV